MSCIFWQSCCRIKQMIPSLILPKVQAVLDSIGSTSGYGAVYHGLHDRTLLQNTVVSSFCRLCLEHPVTGPFCRFACCEAALNAMASGEPHFYRCWAGLLFVTVPVAPQNRCSGGIALGGFYAEGELDDLRTTLRERLGSWTGVDLGPLQERLHALRRITPGELHGVGFLAMESTFSGGLNSSVFFKSQNETYLQQRRIAEAYGDMRAAPPSAPDILSDTHRLASLVQGGNKAEASDYVSKYLARLLMATHWDAARLKAQSRVLLAVLTSQDILNGMPWAAATSQELRLMLRLERAETAENVCAEVSHWVRQRFQGPGHEGSAGRNAAQRLQHWLQAHYQERVTLAAAARATGVSTSTLVHRLRAETGRTFKDLLRGIRIAEAKKLLATTSLEIADIADRSGFSDQSHFTREFKKMINLTPGRFRELLRIPEQALRAPASRSLDDHMALRAAAGRPDAIAAQKKRGVSAPPSLRP